MNRRAKYDAASFILGGGHKRTNTQLPSVKGTDGYPHMPILRPVRADSSDFGFWESKVPKNGRFPAHDADEPPCKI